MESQSEVDFATGHCCECGRSFSKRSDLKRHMITHTGERNYKCSYCRKCFSQKSNLARHTVTHTGEGKFQCSICGKGFSHNSDLNRHMAIHTGNWTFKCLVCGKGFSKKSDFHRHMAVHTGEKKHKCSICGKGVSQKSDLSRHMAVHTGEKKYKCEYCGKLFSQKPNLNTHLNLHLRDTSDRDTSLKCVICGESFLNIHTLAVHLATHVGNGSFQCSVCRKHMSVELLSSAYPSMKDFICIACLEDDDILSSHKRGDRDKNLNSPIIYHGRSHDIEMSGDDSEGNVDAIDDNDDDDDHLSVNDLLEIQLREGHLKTTVVLEDPCSVVDSHYYKTEDEILGLRSEYDELGAVDPLTNENDYTGITTYIIRNEKPLDSNRDSKVEKECDNVIKKECEDDLDGGTVIKEESLESF